MRVISPQTLLLAFDACRREGKARSTEEGKGVMGSQQSDGRVVEVIESEDEVTAPVEERTGIFIGRTRTESWRGQYREPRREPTGN